MRASIWVFIFSRSGSTTWGASAFHGPADDADALPHFFEAHQVPSVDVVFGARGNFEIELLVAGVGRVLAGVDLQSGGAEHGAGDSQVHHVLERNHADALG